MYYIFLFLMFQNLQHELDLKEPEVKQLLAKGDKFLKDASPSAEANAIADTVGELRAEWERVQQDAKEHNARLGAAAALAQHFSDHLDKMLMWMQMTEEKLEKMHPEDLDRESVLQKLKELQVWVFSVSLCYELVCPSIYLFIYLFIYLPINLVYLPAFYISFCLLVYLPIYLSSNLANLPNLYTSVCSSAYLSIYLLIFHLPSIYLTIVRLNIISAIKSLCEF